MSTYNSVSSLLKYQSLRLVLCFIVSFSCLFQAYSQDSLTLFNESTRSQLNLSLSQDQKLDVMISNPIYQSHHFVEFNNINEIQEDGILAIKLPDTNETILFQGKDIRYTNPGEFVFYGELSQCDEPDIGFVHLIAKEGSLFGSFSHNDSMYEIVDYGHEQNVIFSVDPNIDSEHSCGVTHDDGQTQEFHEDEFREEELSRQSDDPTGCVVKVAVFFTSAAMAAGNPRSKAILDIEVTNQVMRNSEVGTRFSLATVSPMPASFMETNSRETLIAFSESEEVVNVMDDAGAHIAVLYTAGSWTSWGIATINEWGQEGEMFANVQITAPSNSYTFTHEIAHLFGCRHYGGRNFGNADGHVWKARANRFRTGAFPYYTLRRTVVHEGRDVVIPYISNPDVDFLGKATGTNKRDNADQFDDFGCIIGEGEEDLSVSITGPGCGINSNSYTICADVEGCPNPTSYVWETSTNGFNYVISSQNTECIDVTLTNYNSLWIRVTVECESGGIATRFHHLLNKSRDPEGCDKDMERITPISISPFSEIEMTFTDNDNLIVSPNPVADEIAIRLNIKKDSHVRIDIINITGQRVYNIENQFMQKGTYSKNQDLSFLQKGIYFVKSEINDNTLITKIIKQ